MNKFILIISMLISSLTILSQNNVIEVSYNYKHFNPTGKEINSQMLLLINKDKSKFFNLTNEIVDSLMSTIEGRMAYSQMTKAAMMKEDVSNLPVKKEPLYIIKDKKDNAISVYDLIGVDFWTYTEPLVPQNWDLSDSTKVILGYECIKATCDYRGRKWDAWFAPEISISDGPWKLNGLPGLILQAIDGTGQYSFHATEIHKTDKKLRPIYNRDGYEKTERIKYLQSAWKFTNNFISYMQAATGTKLENVPKVEINKSYDLIETDYNK